VTVGVIALLMGAIIGTQIPRGPELPIVNLTTTTKDQTIIIISTVSQTVSQNCCDDPNVRISTPCDVMLAKNYLPVQRLQYLIESNPSFISAEGGNNYVTYGATGCGQTFNNNGEINNSTLHFDFSYNTDRSYTNNCGSVEKFTYYIYVRIPLTRTGYNMVSMSIQPTDSSNITYSCSSRSYTSTTSTTTKSNFTTTTVSLSAASNGVPFAPYDITIWTNSSFGNAISNISLSVSQVPSIVRFFASSPSFVFASPSSFQINPSSNGTLFRFSYPNGTGIPYNLDRNQNVLSTQNAVSGWVQIESWPG